MDNLLVMVKNQIDPLDQKEVMVNREKEKVLAVLHPKDNKNQLKLWLRLKAHLEILEDSE